MEMSEQLHDPVILPQCRTAVLMEEVAVWALGPVVMVSEKLSKA